MKYIQTVLYNRLVIKREVPEENAEYGGGRQTQSHEDGHLTSTEHDATSLYQVRLINLTEMNATSIGAHNILVSNGVCSAITVSRMT